MQCFDYDHLAPKEGLFPGFDAYATYFITAREC